MIAASIHAAGRRAGLLLMAWCCVAHAASGADQSRPAATCPADLLGCWATDEKPTQYVRFEDGTCTRVVDGQAPLVMDAAYAPGTVMLSGLGQKSQAAVSVEGKNLTFSVADETKRYRKLDAVPESLVFEPLKIAEPKPVGADCLRVVQAELIGRLMKDQAVRQADESDGEKIREIDVANTGYLKALATELGWIDVERFGKGASLAAFVIVQHSGDVRLMKAVLPFIEKDVKAKHFDGQLYALLYDRLQLLVGGRQRFGTQVIPNAQGEMVVVNLESEDKVDEFRAEIGMTPLRDYLKSLEKAKTRISITIED